MALSRRPPGVVASGENLRISPYLAPLTTLCGIMAAYAFITCYDRAFRMDRQWWLRQPLFQGFATYAKFAFVTLLHGSVWLSSEYPAGLAMTAPDNPPTFRWTTGTICPAEKPPIYRHRTGVRQCVTFRNELAYMICYAADVKKLCFIKQYCYACWSFYGRAQIDFGPPIANPRTPIIKCRRINLPPPLFGIIITD